MNASPIDGVAIISSKDTDLTMVTARLSDSDSDLVQFILGQAQFDAVPSPSK